MKVIIFLFFLSTLISTNPIFGLVVKEVYVDEGSSTQQRSLNQLNWQLEDSFLDLLAFRDSRSVTRSISLEEILSTPQLKSTFDAFTTLLHGLPTFVEKLVNCSPGSPQLELDGYSKVSLGLKATLRKLLTDFVDEPKIDSIYQPKVVQYFYMLISQSSYKEYRRDSGLELGVEIFEDQPEKKFAGMSLKEFRDMYPDIYKGLPLESFASTLEGFQDLPIKLLISALTGFTSCGGAEVKGEKSLDKFVQYLKDHPYCNKEQEDWLDPRLYYHVENYFSSQASDASYVVYHEMFNNNNELARDFLYNRQNPKTLESLQAFFLSTDIGFLKRSDITEIVDVAYQIVNITRPGDNLVIFGNTPYWVGRALEMLVSKDKEHCSYRNIIYFPCSGCPGKPRNIVDFSNDILTLYRQENFKQHIMSKGLMPPSDLLRNPTYIIDVVGTGGGPAALIEAIVDASSDSCEPPISVLTLNHIDRESKNPDTKKRHRLITRENMPGYLFLNGPNKLLQVPYISTVLTCHSKLDDVRGYQRFFPETPARTFVERYWGKLPENSTDYMKIFREYFDLNARNHVKSLESSGTSSS